MLATWNAWVGNIESVTHVNIIHVNLPVLSLEFFIGRPHRLDSRHRIPQVFRCERSRLHIERLLGQLCYLRLIPAYRTASEEPGPEWKSGSVHK
jgi:hypothetical protein